MLRGDISNVSPSRWLVTLDALLEPATTIPKKKIFRSWDDTARSTSLAPLQLGRIWQASNRYGTRFELVVFGQSEDYCSALERNLERWGINPIVWVTGHASRFKCGETLAYRPDVQAVVDLPDKTLFWGNRGLSIYNL